MTEWWVRLACIEPAKVLEDELTTVLGHHVRAALSRERARRGRVVKLPSIPWTPAKVTAFNEFKPGTSKARRGKGAR